MNSIADIAAECRNSETPFKEKRVLWIGSESYVAPAITVLQGLDALGFEICTLFKPNINSWFCNKIIDGHEAANSTFDFVLSATHWGTDWPAYHRYNLGRWPKVLIDGDDAQSFDTWQIRHERHSEMYKPYPISKARKKRERFKFRWMAPLEGYGPDVLFTMQKQFGDIGHYIPSGIHFEYLRLGESRLLSESHQRRIDFCHIVGPGVWRRAMSDLIRLGHLPRGSTIYNTTARGEAIYIPELKDHIKADQGLNVHSYHRWVSWRAFWDILSASKILIHPGIDHWPFWDCKRPYEGWAAGCFMLMAAPITDVSDYPPTDIWPEGVYHSHDELADKARYYFAYQDELEDAREGSHRRALDYLTPIPVARYFLKRVADEIF